ncbi:hypothetical protein JXA56_04220, partial [Candidatus Micrarchaeota archaeon]|nr:hypothetical protein [Candidatus Micrarchaeota archaeon]
KPREKPKEKPRVLLPPSRVVGAVPIPVPGPSAAAPSRKQNLPKAVREGEGTKKDRYEIYRSRSEVDNLLTSSTSQVSDTIIVMPITLEMGEHGTHYVNVNVVLSQLSKKNYEETLQDIAKILRDIMRVKGVPSSVSSARINSAVQVQIRAEITRLQSRSDDVGKYLRSH